MKVTHDVNIDILPSRNIHRKEYNAIDDFLSSTHTSLCMEYDEGDKFIYRKLKAMHKHIKYYKLPLSVHKRGNFLIFLRKGDKE